MWFLQSTICLTAWEYVLYSLCNCSFWNWDSAPTTAFHSHYSYWTLRVAPLLYHDNRFICYSITITDSFAPSESHTASTSFNGSWLFYIYFFRLRGQVSHHSLLPLVGRILWTQIRLCTFLYCYLQHAWSVRSILEVTIDFPSGLKEKSISQSFWLTSSFVIETRESSHEISHLLEVSEAMI